MRRIFLKNLAGTFLKNRSAKAMEYFLENMLTPGEIEEIAQRIEIIKLLHQGMPHREVAKKLKISIGTVSRGARVFKYGRPGLNKIV